MEFFIRKKIYIDYYFRIMTIIYIITLFFVIFRINILSWFIIFTFIILFIYFLFIRNILSKNNKKIFIIFQEITKFVLLLTIFFLIRFIKKSSI